MKTILAVLLSAFFAGCSEPGPTKLSSSNPDTVIGQIKKTVGDDLLQYRKNSDAYLALEDKSTYWSNLGRMSKAEETLKLIDVIALGVSDKNEVINQIADRLRNDASEQCASSGPLCDYANGIRIEAKEILKTVESLCAVTPPTSAKQEASK